jgi:hypothetical protein
MFHGCFINIRFWRSFDCLDWPLWFEFRPMRKGFGAVVPFAAKHLKNFVVQYNSLNKQTTGRRKTSMRSERLDSKHSFIRCRASSAAASQWDGRRWVHSVAWLSGNAWLAPTWYCSSLQEVLRHVLINRRHEQTNYNATYWPYNRATRHHVNVWQRHTSTVVQEEARPPGSRSVQARHNLLYTESSG